MFNRRELIEGAAIGGGIFAATSGGPTVAAASRARPSPPRAPLTKTAERIFTEIYGFELDDTHCHAITPGMWVKDRRISVEHFLLRISLVGMAIAGYLPAGVWGEWEAGDADVRASLDRKYGIEKLIREVVVDFRETAFVKLMTKEMAGYLGCRPRLEEVIEARNARAQNYGRYVSDMFRDINLANVMTDTGCCEGVDFDGLTGYQKAITPTTVRQLARVDRLQGDLLRQNLSFDDLEGQFTTRVRAALDGTGSLGFRTYGMKSYLLPQLGLLRPVYDRSVAAASWSEYKANRPTSRRGPDRDEQYKRGEQLLLFLLTIAMEECLARDMPMQFHAGDGEAPGVVLRNQHPYYLEEMVRFDKDGLMRRPKVIPIHGGYPLVGEETWLCHLYPNCYYEMSIMAPYIHQGLADRLREVWEAVPFSKTLYGSDAWSMPEQYWLAGRWAKRFMSEALGVYVDEGVLTHAEAVEAAKRVCHQNNRALYNLG